MVFMAKPSEEGVVTIVRGLAGITLIYHPTVSKAAFARV
jgi:hypothetical protein